ncbi:MAG: hypothetical protein WBH04_09510 [Albidovulum sp.]
MLADQSVDGTQIVAVFFNGRDAEFMPRGVVDIFGNGAPKDIAGRFIIPYLRQSEGQDEKVGCIEDPPGFRLNGGVVAIFLGLIAMPKRAVERLVFPSPFELLTNDKGIDHAFAASHHIGILGGVIFVENAKAALGKPVGDIGGKTAAKGGDLGVGGNDRRLRHPAFQHEFLCGLDVKQPGNIRVEIRMLAAKPCAKFSGVPARGLKGQLAGSGPVAGDNRRSGGVVFVALVGTHRLINHGLYALYCACPFCLTEVYIS